MKQVTINTVNATLYIILYWKMLFYCDMFQFSFEPSSGNIHSYYENYYTYNRFVVLVQITFL
jgi:hypothetical protein